MPKYSARIAALLLATTLCMPLMGGCDASGGTAGTSGTTDATNSAADTDGTTGTRAGSAASSTDAASSSDTAVQSSALTYEGYLDESGLWDGVRALDYVTLPEDYAHISVPADQVAVNDDDVQAQIDSLASSYATTAEVTDRAVEDGDTVNIDYVGTIDGVEFDGGSTQGAGTTVTIGVTSYIDDFLEQLIGHMPGETFDVEVTFPDDYGVDELNGKDAVFSVTINHIEEQELPTIDDEWVSANLESSLGVSTLDELKSSIRDSLTANAVTSYVQSYVLTNSEASELPQAIVEAQEQNMVAQYQSYAGSYGMELSDFLSMTAGVSTTDELIEANRSSLDEAARAYLIYQAIAEDAGIEATTEETASYILDTTGSSDFEAYAQVYGLPYLKLGALMDEVTNMLVDGATVE